MQFNSLEYAVFLLLVLAVYYGAARTFLAQKILIVVASALFYAFWSPTFLLHFFGMVSLNYWASLWMERMPTRRGKLCVLWLMIIVDLVNLGVFKYATLFVDSANWLLGALAPDAARFARPDIVLPLAISFYTFHVVSYLVDLYRGHAHSKPAGLLDFLFYVTLFPHQIAGPILRGHELFPQLGYKPLAAQNLRQGFERIVLGLFQKAVIADNLAIIVDHGMRNHASISGVEMYVVMIAYSFQIFFDFAGYSNMGIGSARLLGYALPENFNTPYIAGNIAEFWRRWHMTLSRWIRDYIYIPLGGSHGGPTASVVNLIITMALAGLWHGASWTFMVWGLYHGVGLAAHRVYAASKVRVGLVSLMPPVAYQFITIAVTFHFVMLGWVLFRAPDFSTAWDVYGKLFGLLAPGALRTLDAAYLLKSYGFTAVALYGLWIALRGVPVAAAFVEANRRRRAMGYALVLYLVILLVPTHTEPFIYFQF